MTKTTPEIEYEYYRLVRETVHKPQKDEFRIENASLGFCGLCGTCITGMGGNSNMVCINCGDMMQRGQLRACVVREGTKHD